MKHLMILIALAISFNLWSQNKKDEVVLVQTTPFTVYKTTTSEDIRFSSTYDFAVTVKSDMAACIKNLLSLNEVNTEEDSFTTFSHYKWWFSVGDVYISFNFMYNGTPIMFIMQHKEYETNKYYGLHCFLENKFLEKYKDIYKSEDLIADIYKNKTQ